MQNTLERKKNGGKRPGAGRPRGTKSKIKQKLIKTKEEALELFNNKVYGVTSKLFNAQMIVAQGSHKMVHMYKDDEGVMHIETIKSEATMDDLIATGEYGKDYVIVVGSMPDARAADMLLNRSLGKPIESLEIGNKDNQPFILNLKK